MILPSIMRSIMDLSESYRPDWTPDHHVQRCRNDGRRPASSVNDDRASLTLASAAGSLRRARLVFALRAVSGIGQPIELASQAVQPHLDGSRCHSFCGPAGLCGFPAIILRRQRWGWSMSRSISGPP